MTEVQTAKTKDLNKGFGITKEDEKRAIAVTYTIDANKRKVTDKVDKTEHKMTN